MFSTSSVFSLPFGLPRFLSGQSGSAVNIKSVEIHNIDTGRDKRTRTLKHLIKLNHANHAVLFNDLEFHNHTPHILGSAYLLKATPKHLDDIYVEESKDLVPWEDSPHEISTHDWRDHLGDRLYQRAYVDFFEDELVLHGYDWRKVLDKYLFEGKEPLYNCLIGGLGHPLIHLGYAYELSSREVAMEALCLATTQYNYLHRYLDNPAYSKASTSGSSSLLEILNRVVKDQRFDHGADSVEAVFKNHEAAFLEHWNAWTPQDPTKQFQESQFAATALFVATHPLQGPKKDYNFFFVHLLTTSHAVRIILPLISPKYHVPLVRQWWLFTLAVYIAFGRPHIDLDNISNFDPQGADWATVDKLAVESKWSLDAHYVKALRAMKAAAEVWGDPDLYYLKAAVRYDRDFDGWGFGDANVSVDDPKRHQRGNTAGL